jgi:ribosome-binding ATPase YchF (GTP1/OBG family)
LKAGIIGLPEVGKTTLFNALTHGSVPVAAFGGHRPEANVGVIAVPDTRFNRLVEVYKPKKVSPASMEVIDGAAPIGVEQHKDTFGTDFFAGIRAVSALIHVVRAFQNPALPEMEGGLNPLRDVKKVNDELMFADLQLPGHKSRKRDCACPDSTSCGRGAGFQSPHPEACRYYFKLLCACGNSNCRSHFYNLV